jgi:hypothetical protein
MKIKRISAAAVDGSRRFYSRALNGEEKLWKVWWLIGIPVGWTAAALVIIAEELRYAGHHGWGDFLDLARFLIYFAWLRLAWRCSRNVGKPVWTPAAQAALAGGLVFMAIF